MREPGQAGGQAVQTSSGWPPAAACSQHTPVAAKPDCIDMFYRRTWGDFGGFNPSVSLSRRGK